MVDFTVTYQSTPDEMARGLQQGLKRQLRIAYILLPSILVAGGLFCILVDLTIVGISMLVAAVGFPFAVTWWIRRMAKGQLAHLCVPTTLRVTSEGYECRTDQFTTTMQWSMYGQIVTTPEFWLFYVDKRLAAFVPKNAFPADQQAELDRFFAMRQNQPPSSSTPHPARER